MHIINTTCAHLKGIQLNISNFEISMTISKYLDTSYISNLEGDIAVLQDYSKTHEKEATTCASKFKDDGQAYSFHDQTIQHIYGRLERKKLRSSFYIDEYGRK